MKTIRQQLTQKLLLAFALLLACGGAGVYFSTRTALLEQFDETLRTKANAISSGTEQQEDGINIEVSEQIMPEFHEGEAVGFFQLRRTDGTTVKRSQSLAGTNLPSRFGTFRKPAFWNLTLPSGSRGRAIGYAFTPQNANEDDSRQPGQLTIVVAATLGELNETLAVLALMLLGCGVLLLAAVLLIVPRVLRHEIAPLNQLAEQTSRITANSLSTRFPTDSVPGELQPISERLNNLLCRLEQSFEREREFSADLAHELRTPIAELRSLADVSLKWPKSRPVETDRDTLDIAVQMERIVVRLLELLRSEHGQLTPAPEAVLLAPLAARVWHPFADKAAEKQLKLFRNVPDDAAIQSDPVLLGSILTNLVDNAVEYTPRGGKILMDCGVCGGWFTVRISNSTEHIDRADLAKLFDRFWRKDPARSSASHSGLGLSLARGFAEALGCELAATLDGQSLLVMTLSGPAVLKAKAPPSVRV